MLSRVQIVCFASTYAIVLALEVSRLFFKSGIRRVVLVVAALAGLTAHSIYLFYRAAYTSGVPLSSSRDWYLLAAWVVAVVYLYLLYVRPRVPFGLLLLPLVLGLIGTAVWLADARAFAQEPASKAWGVIHGASLLLATVAVLLGFAAGITYLWQRWQLKRKRPVLGGLRLPSLEWLERANVHATMLALLLLGIGIASGMILNLIRRPEAAGRLPLRDPVVAATMGMFVWLLVAAVVAHLHHPGWKGHRVAYLTVASFVVLLIVLAMGLLVNTQHGGGKGAGRALPQVRFTHTTSVIHASSLYLPPLHTGDA